MKRKNFNAQNPCDSDDIQTGVDINRNYDYKFGYDEEGSVRDPCDDIYRGTHAFSEPETQAISGFCKNRSIQFALNAHAFGNAILFPNRA